MTSTPVQDPRKRFSDAAKMIEEVSSIASGGYGRRYLDELTLATTCSNGELVGTSWVATVLIDFKG